MFGCKQRLSVLDSVLMLPSACWKSPSWWCSGESFAAFACRSCVGCMTMWMVVYLNAAALLSGLELTVTQQRTAQAHLIPDPAEWTLWILSNFTRSSVLLRHLFSSFHHCIVNLCQFPASPRVSASSLHDLFCCSSSLPVSDSPLFLCDAAAPFCSEAAKIAHEGHQAVLGSHPSLFCFPVSGFFLFFFTHPAPLQPGSNWA